MCGSFIPVFQSWNFLIKYGDRKIELRKAVEDYSRLQRSFTNFFLDRQMYVYGRMRELVSF